MGNEDNDDWIEFEGDDDPRVHEVPEEAWTEAHRQFMETHGDCLRYEEVRCFQERDDLIFYDFEKDEHYDFVVDKLAEWAAKLPGRSLDYAKLDFNELAEATGDEIGDDNETYEQFNIPIPELIKHWPSYAQKMCYYIFDYALPIYQAALPAGQHLPDNMPNIDRNISGNPLQPVCCQCLKLDTPNKFHKKKSVCSEWEFDRVNTLYNPFIFQGEEWKPGKRYTTTGPYFCGDCLKHWFWDETQPKDTRLYYWHPDIRFNFEHTVLTWSFGEQLRQALNYGDVHIESEC